MTPVELLEQVQDRDSFIRFVRSLADEREAAIAEEQKDPIRYAIDGAHGWKNAEISAFLYARLEYFKDRPLRKPEPNPSWQMLAEFLCFGKIYE